MLNFGLFLLLLVATRSFAYFSNGDGSPGYFESSNGKEKYIVYMGAKKSGVAADALVTSHQNLLASVLGSHEEAQASMFYTYKHSFSGFSAWLTPSEAQRTARQPGVVKVFASQLFQLQTTRSWDFVGLSDVGADGFSSAPPARMPNGQGDVIIGVLDTGVWPELPSFSDEGMGPVPARWKGGCENYNSSLSDAIHCNKKLIGAKAYNVPLESLYKNARDEEGHGTHTTSTAGGRVLKGASLFGLANGTAKGGLPGARLAMYKVCYANGCSGDTILAAFDDAIHDGVDILSLSLGGAASSYETDPIAIGSFHATENGILVSCAAGNSGPQASTLSNGAPWILTVGASTLDRKFTVTVKLGNGKTVQGGAFNLQLEGKPSKLITGTDAAINAANATLARFCSPQALDVNKVKGSILVCEFSPILRSAVSRSLRKMGAAGFILGNDIFSELLVYLAIPGAVVNLKTFKEIVDYANTGNATASILPTQTDLGVAAPTVAGFSSRGPNTISRDVLKPDVIAPGLNILAAWPTKTPLYFLGENSTEPVFSGNYSIISGTSMACPHATGAAAYVKFMHPNWSPSAIKSALVTTAIPVDNKGNEIRDFDASTASLFAAGAGEISPEKAANPGLVYDATVEDYLTYLCQSGYDAKKLAIIAGHKLNETCSTGLPDLNYPSVTVPSMGKKFTVTRTVTNVGPAIATYSLKTKVPDGIRLTVSPTELSFSAVGQKMSYQLEFEATKRLPADWGFGFVAWSSGSVIVRSPIAIKP